MAGDLLARIDRIMAELQAIRDALAGNNAPAASTAHRETASYAPPADDLADAALIDTTSAQERFGYPRNTLAKWCREDGLGVMRGGRWLVSVPRLRRRLNGG
jgi:hypothetical protein